MKNITILLSVLAIAACGGGSKPPPATPDKTTETTTTTDTKTETKTETKPEEKEATPPPPPAPKVAKAKAELAPVKGQKFKAATVTFSQQEGEPVSVKSDGFEGIKPGKYHLVVHAAADCGANATKAGAAVKGGADMGFAVAKDSASIDVSGVAAQIEGEQAIVGHVLVLHDDKGGKAGKALACGPIAVLDAAD